MGYKNLQFFSFLIFSTPLLKEDFFVKLLISKLYSILAEANLLAHSNISKFNCIVLQLTTVF